MQSKNPYESPKSEFDNFGSDQPPVEFPGMAWLFFSFEGRIPRRQYWGASILMTIVFYAGVFALAAIFGGESQEASIGMLLLYIPFIWTSLAVTVKRWHDRDKSGWWILIGIIPIIGPIWAFIETGCLRGTHGYNNYGPDPT